MSAERFYGLMLRVYPTRFRVRFEAGMRDGFRRDHAAARDEGLAVLARFWALTIVQDPVVPAWPNGAHGKWWEISRTRRTGARRPARPGSAWIGAMPGAR